MATKPNFLDLIQDLHVAKKFIQEGFNKKEFRQLINKYRFPKIKTNLYRGGYLTYKEADIALISKYIVKDKEPLYSFSTSDKVAVSFFKTRPEVKIVNLLLHITNEGYSVETVYLDLLNKLLQELQRISKVKAPFITRRNLLKQIPNINAYIKAHSTPILKIPEVINQWSNVIDSYTAKFLVQEKEVVVLSPMIIKDIRGIRVHKNFDYEKLLTSPLANKINPRSASWVSKLKTDKVWYSKFLTITKTQIRFEEN